MTTHAMDREIDFLVEQSSNTTDLNYAMMPVGATPYQRRSTLTHNDLEMLFSIFAQPEEHVVDSLAPFVVLKTPGNKGAPFSAAVNPSIHVGAMKKQALRRPTLTHGDIDMLFSAFSSEGSSATDDAGVSATISDGEGQYPPDVHKVDEPSRRSSLQNASDLDSLLPSHLSQICEDLNKSRKDRIATKPASRRRPPSSLMHHENNKRNHDLLSSGGVIKSMADVGRENPFKSKRPRFEIAVPPSSTEGIRQYLFQLDSAMDKSETSLRLLRDSEKRMELKHPLPKTMSQSQESRKKIKEHFLEGFLSQQSAKSA